MRLASRKAMPAGRLRRKKLDPQSERIIEESIRANKAALDELARR